MGAHANETMPAPISGVTGRLVQEDDLVEQAMPPEHRLVEDAGPARVGELAQLRVEADVTALLCQPGCRKELSARIGVPVMLHEQVTVQVARGNHEADRAKLGEQRLSLTAR